MSILRAVVPRSRSNLGKWLGRCDEAVEFYLSQGIPGVRRDGVWIGPPPATWGRRDGRWATDNEGRYIHVWIERPDGSIFDPTRWALEGAWPCIYEGPNDFYVATYRHRPCRSCGDGLAVWQVEGSRCPRCIANQTGE